MENTKKKNNQYTTFDILTGQAKNVAVEVDPRDAGEQYRVEFAPNFGETTIEGTAKALLNILETTESEMRHSLTGLARANRHSNALENMVSSLVNDVTIPLEDAIQAGITEDGLDHMVVALTTWLDTLSERGVTVFAAWRLRLIRAVEAIEPKSEEVAAL